MNTILEIDDRWLSFQDIKNLLHYDQDLAISFKAKKAIETCRHYLERKLEVPDAVYYGINTGFGFLQNVRIGEDQLRQLQENLIKSHACGLGEAVPDEIIKLMLMLKIKSLSYGFSGVRIELVNQLANLYNHRVLPIIYSQGSLGASGDLAPLSHLSLPLIGLGKVKHQQQIQEAADVNKLLGWQSLKLESKEGLALINGTQFMSAYGLHILIIAERLIKWADFIGAASFDAFNCSEDCLHEKLHSVRPHPGQVATAKQMKQWLKGRELVGRIKQELQDPYSFRCIPQVHGATRDTFEYALKVILLEINSVTDNPNIFPDEDMILSGGNFHGQPLSLVLDFLAIAMSELANISERRCFQLLGGHRDLPLFLVKDPGLHSGLMIPQYTAAGIVSENKQLCTPSSVDSISSSNNQEDHVSMGANAATKCLRVVLNVQKVLAIELLTAIQALEFRQPMTSSIKIAKVVNEFRKVVSFNTADRVVHYDMLESIEFMNRNVDEYSNSL